MYLQTRQKLIVTVETSIISSTNVIPINLIYKKNKPGPSCFCHSLSLLTEKIIASCLYLSLGKNKFLKMFSQLVKHFI